MDESLLLPHDESQAQQEISSRNDTVLSEEGLDSNNSDESSTFVANQRRKLILLLGSSVLLAIAVVSTASFFSSYRGGVIQYRKNFLNVDTQVTSEIYASGISKEEKIGTEEGKCYTKNYVCGSGKPPCCDGLKCKQVCRHPPFQPTECNPNKYSCQEDDNCFSSETRVEVIGKGIVPIHKVNVGDSIKSSKDGTYSKVFGFHRNDSTETLFHRIHIGTNSVLEVTPRHMVFLNGMQYPIPAGQVKVGDELQQQLDDSNEIKQPEKVTKIDLVQRKGYYAPITEHGTLVVGGIVASSFSVHPDNKKDDSAHFDKMGLIHWHGLSQVAISPVRFICKTMWSGFCTDASFHDEEGLHKYIVLLKTLRGMADWQQTIVLPAVLGVGLLFSSAEFLYDSIVGSSVKLLVEGGEAGSDAILASVTTYEASETML